MIGSSTAEYQQYQQCVFLRMLELVKILVHCDSNTPAPVIFHLFSTILS